MNFITFLIIVQFMKNVICLFLNSSLYGSLDTTINYLSRHKRASLEYTRWQANFEPTEEFIVKVFEEDSPSRNSELDPINIGNLGPENDGKNPISSGRDPDSAETEADSDGDHLMIDPFPKSNVGDNDNVPVYSNNKIISPKMYKGKLDTKYPKVKYMSVQNDNKDALLGSRFLSNLDTSVQQFAPIAPALTQETTSPPLLQIKPLPLDKKYVPQLNKKSTRTSPVSDVVLPMRTFQTENFSPKRTLNTESFSLRNIVTDSFSPFEYIHPIRTTAADKPLLKLKNILNMRTGITRKVPDKITEAYVDVDVPYKDEDSESMPIELSNNKEFRATKNYEEHEDQTECQETDLDIMEASTGSANSTYLEKEFTSEVTYTTFSNFIRQGSARRHQSFCTLIKTKEFDGSHRTLYEINTQLKKWAENSPVTKWVDITNGNYTAMENPIYMMIVDDLSKGQIVSAKETVLIVAGIQGKDHHAVSAAMSLLQQLIEKSESHSNLLRKYRFWIIPVLNPDGYEYSITFPLRRQWVKNLRQTWNLGKDDDCLGCQEFGISCTIQSCYGVNIDRNFEYQWIPTKELQAEHPCGSLYAGPRQLSEVETRSLTQYLDHQEPIHTFIAYKEGDVLGILYPHSHTKKKRPSDNVYRVRALRAAAAASVVGGRTYVYGQASEFLPLYAGGIEDWVDGHVGIDNTYSIMMMRPSDDGDSKALTERVLNEAYAATQALLFHPHVELSQSPVAIRSRNKGTKISTNYIVFITCVVLLGNG